MLCKQNDMPRSVAHCHASFVVRKGDEKLIVKEDNENFSPVIDENKEEYEAFDGLVPKYTIRPDIPPTTRKPNNITEQIDSTMAKMNHQKRTLLAIIDYCQQPRYSAEIDEYLTTLKEQRHSVYTPIAMREILQNSGALTYIEAEGSSDENELLTDGDGNLIVTEKPEGTWQSTADGLAYLKAQDPYQELTNLIHSKENKKYEEIFFRLLKYCATEGRSADDISSIIDGDPLLEEPLRLAGYFIGPLEKTGALVWTGLWNTTTIGLRYIEETAAEGID